MKNRKFSGLSLNHPHIESEVSYVVFNGAYSIISALRIADLITFLCLKSNGVILCFPKHGLQPTDGL